MATVFKLRRDTAANWTSRNPTLADGEPGVEKDTAKMKIGDGNSPWNALPYTSSGSSGGGGTPIPGARGSLWYNGVGPPSSISGQAANDQYRNTSNDDVYSYSGTAWVPAGNISGLNGLNGATWFDGNGAPGTISGQKTNDQYRDIDTDDIYTFNGSSWQPAGNIGGADGLDGSNNEITQNLNGTWNLRVSKVSDSAIVCKWYKVVVGSANPPISVDYMQDTYPYDEFYDKTGS